MENFGNELKTVGTECGWNGTSLNSTVAAGGPAHCHTCIPYYFKTFPRLQSEVLNSQKII